MAGRSIIMGVRREFLVPGETLGLVSLEGRGLEIDDFSVVGDRDLLSAH